MKIYLLKYVHNDSEDYVMATASEETALYFEQFCREKGEIYGKEWKHNIQVVDVKTQGKNFHQIALPEKYKLPF